VDALDELKYLKAIEEIQIPLNSEKKVKKDQITDLGKVLSYMPIQPKYGKLLLLARAMGHMEYGVLLVSAICCDHIYSKRDLKLFFEEKDNKKRIVIDMHNKGQ
jgi:HrpA-like RNA helicase